MKLRVMAVGAVELVLSIVLYVIRGYHPAYLALLGIGIALIIAGLFWR
jgi:membrane-bound ClpP family serine protease